MWKCNNRVFVDDNHNVNNPRINLGAIASRNKKHAKDRFCGDKDTLIIVFFADHGEFEYGLPTFVKVHAETTAMARNLDPENFNIACRDIPGSLVGHCQLIWDCEAKKFHRYATNLGVISKEARDEAGLILESLKLPTISIERLHNLELIDFDLVVGMSST